MSRLTSKQVAEWCDTLCVNIPDIHSISAFRDAIIDRNVNGIQFDELLHSNKLCREFREEWPDMSPVTAVLIRKLWHTDFYPKTKNDSWCVHHRGREPPKTSSLQLDDMADMVEHIVDVVTPSCSLNRDEIFSRINRVIPTDVSNKLRESHSQI